MNKPIRGKADLTKGAAMISAPDALAAATDREAIDFKVLVTPEAIASLTALGHADELEPDNRPIVRVGIDPITPGCRLECPTLDEIAEVKEPNERAFLLWAFLNMNPPCDRVRAMVETVKASIYGLTLRRMIEPPPKATPAPPRMRKVRDVFISYPKPSLFDADLNVLPLGPVKADATSEEKGADGE